MKSPLNIQKTIKRYNLDEDMAAKLIDFDNFIWQDIEITSVTQLLDFEKKYQRLAKQLGMCFDSEIGEFGCVDMEDGPMDFLMRGCFQYLYPINDVIKQNYVSAGLTELEILIIRSFKANISPLYRLDAYHYGIPPFIKSLCIILNDAISKLPKYKKWVVRACRDQDKSDFKVGDEISFGFCLTTSADLSWSDESENRYRIKPLDSDSSHARALFLINDDPEKQVNFLQDTRFRIVDINDWGEGKKEFVMCEI